MIKRNLIKRNLIKRNLIKRNLINIKDNPDFIKGINNIKDNPFMSNIRKKYFLENYNNLWINTESNTTIYLFLPTSNLNYKWKNLIKLLFWRINFMRKLFNNYKPLEIWIYPGKQKKCLRDSINNPITVDNINSGSTTTYNNNDNGIICLWRKEEILKVLLHELIHSFKVDRKDPIPEAYVELRALLANIYLELLGRRIPLKNVNKLLECEKQFAVEQSKKIKGITTDTNIHYYISEKGRLLHNMNKKEWKEYVNKKQSGKQVDVLRDIEHKNYVNKNSLRFTITDQILKDYPRKDFNGNVLTIP